MVDAKLTNDNVLSFPSRSKLTTKNEVKNIIPPIVGVPCFPLCSLTYFKIVWDALSCFVYFITKGATIVDISKARIKAIIFFSTYFSMYYKYAVQI